MLCKGVAAGIARQKARVIKENAKYSFVELGKFNTSVYTRRISNSFRSELPEWDPRGGAVEGRGEGERERERDHS